MSVEIEINIEIDFDIRREIERLISDIEQKFERLTSKVNGLLSFVPDFLEWAVSALIDAWNSLLDEMRAFWITVAEIMSHVGSPAALSRLADTWSSKIAGTAGSLRFEFDDLAAGLHNTWEGNAADTYGAEIPRQRNAVESLHQDHAANVAEALGSMASAIKNFWWIIAGVLAALAVAVAGGIVAIVTLVGAAPGILTIVGAVIVASIGIGHAISNLGGTADDAASLLKREGGLSSWPIPGS